MSFAPRVRGILYPTRAAMESETALVAGFVGSVYEITPEGRLNREAQRFLFDLYMEITGGAGTLRAWFVASDDGATWQAVAVSDTLSAGAVEVRIEPLYLLKYVGIVVAWTGTAVYDLSCNLLSNLNASLTVKAAMTIDTSLLVLPSDTDATIGAGMATVGTGNTTVDVTFANPYPSTDYGVALTPQTNVVAWVTQKTASGFRINISAPLAAPLEVDWIASAT
jgi:hypothetical protein